MYSELKEMMAEIGKIQEYLASLAVIGKVFFISERPGAGQTPKRRLLLDRPYRLEADRTLRIRN
jgi:hypothetical protein